MIDVQITGVDLTVQGLEDVSNAVLRAAFEGVIEALVEAEHDCRDMISLSDHSLKDLAELGHPYGFKHPAQIHDPDEAVHIQSGRYVAALKVTKPRSYADRDIVEGRVGIQGDSEMETLDQRIQLGTEKMRARPWAKKVVETHGAEYGEIIAKRIADQLEAEEVA